MRNRKARPAPGPAERGPPGASGVFHQNALPRNRQMGLEGAKDDPRSSLPAESHARNRADLETAPPPLGLHAQEGGCGRSLRLWARCPDPRSEDAPTAPGTREPARSPHARAAACSGSEEEDGEEGPRLLPWKCWWTLPKATSVRLRPRACSSLSLRPAGAHRHGRGGPSGKNKLQPNWTTGQRISEPSWRQRPLAATAKCAVLKVSLRGTPGPASNEKFLLRSILQKRSPS